MSDWYKHSTLSDECNYDTHCRDCDQHGVCHTCDTIDGRFVDAVADYASTCDGCGELFNNDCQTTDEKTDLGYCHECWKKLKEPS